MLLQKKIQDASELTSCIDEVVKKEVSFRILTHF